MKTALRIFTMTILQVVVYLVTLTVLTELCIFIGGHLGLQQITAELQNWFTLVLMMSSIVFAGLYLTLNVMIQTMKDRKIITTLGILALIVVLMFFWSEIGHRPYRLTSVIISGLFPVLILKSQKTKIRAPDANNN